MAVSPGTYNITLQRRADFSLQLQFRDSTGSAINLTGWAVASQAWNEARTTKYADFTVSYLDRTNGTVSIALTAAQTSSLPETSNYDVLLTNPSGLKEYYLEGSLATSQGYTA